MANSSFGISGATPFTGRTGQSISGIRGALAPQQNTPPNAVSGFLNSRPQPTTPVKSTTVTAPDGTSHTQTYHTDTSGNAGSTSPVQSTAATTGGNSGQPQPTTPQVGTPVQNAQNVLNQSNLSTNPQYQQGTQNALLINAAQQNSNIAGQAGQGNNLNQQSTDLLGTPYSNIFRPQSTANLAGEKGLLNPLLSQAGTFATGEQQAAINAGTLGTQGATSVLNAGLPQSYSYQSNVMNPLTGQQFGAGGAGQGGAFFGGQQAGEAAAGQNSAGMVHALGAAQAVGNNLTSLITNANINPADPQFVNSINHFLQTGVASNPQYQQFYGAVNDYVASLAPILGVGGSPTDQKTSMAAQMVSQLASGKSIQQTIAYFDQLAQQKIQGFNQGGNFGTSTGSTGTSGSTGGSSFGWNGQ